MCKLLSESETTQVVQTSLTTDSSLTEGYTHLDNHISHIHVINSFIIVYKGRCQSINQSLYFKRIVFKAMRLVGSFILGACMLMFWGNLQC